jgi:hypothetical protein
MAVTTETEIRSSNWSQRSTAPNGSSSSIDHWTSVVSRQDWANVPENGIYAGLSYKITRLYISPRADTRGQSVSSSSSPWIE